jgi:hypothetical protein
MFTEYKTVPTALVGSSTKEEWVYNSNNGKPATGVAAGQYGAWFAINKNASTTKSYSKEKTYSNAFEIPTPVGSFSGSVTTAYKSAHSINWSTTNNTTYYHYDMDNTLSMFYATY